MNLVKRVSVALIGIPIILWVFWSDGLPLLIFGGLLSALMSWELFRMFKRNGNLPNILSIPFSIMVYFAVSLYGWQALPVILLPFMVVIFTNRLLRNKIDRSICSISFTLFIFIYAGILPSTIYQITNFNNGNWLLILILVLTWITDSFAYFIGMTLGKHRGIFPVSPKKSLEGFIAGAVFSLIAVLVIRLINRDLFTLTQLIAAALTTGFIGQLGDLMESLIKRDMKVKDSSNLIPGHGGILDRFDSFLISVAFLYVILFVLSIVEYR
ncbi:MAG: phosphatidate cytidylyltransferase [Candidatus Cloacimonetes bacterium]|nr:phosphatidate cytidylyltransferase [Candidatus Cloacimonadota bacterium]